jgi:UDP-2,3-diacylglucosamine pyrophosphatase LpxH
MANGAVISDLHLFARRTETHRIIETLLELPADLEHLVLNGDIVDFRWSSYPSEAETVAAGKLWLQGLLEQRPALRVYYVMGNHDCSAPWAEALDQLSPERFTWSPTHVKLGSHLFLHGDLVTGEKNPFIRVLTSSHKHFASSGALDRFYHALIHTRVHVGVSRMHGPERYVPKVERALRTYGADFLYDTSDIYFGHTHEPFSDYEYRGLRFHNTGSAVRHIKLRALRFRHE